MIQKILFVCTGNTCRSSMAEVILKKVIQDKKIDNLEVDSAGLFALEGAPASLQAQEVAQKKGLSLQEHQAKNLTIPMLEKADLILTMTTDHKDNILDYLPEHRDKVFSLKEFVNAKGRDISDPFGQSVEVYEETYEELLENILKVLALIRKEENTKRGLEKMKIALGSDHGGFFLKEEIKKYLEEKKIEYKDFGTNTTESCDYPDIAKPVALSVVNKEFDRGILVCGTGIGIGIAANKVKGVRAALCHDTFSAHASREHNDANILTLGERIVGKGLALEIVDTWLKAEFEGDRHQRRIDKISAIEEL